MSEHRPRKRQPDVTQQRLLDAAGDLVAEVGVAERAGRDPDPKGRSARAYVLATASVRDPVDALIARLAADGLWLADVGRCVPVVCRFMPVCLIVLYNF